MSRTKVLRWFRPGRMRVPIHWQLRNRPKRPACLDRLQSKILDVYVVYSLAFSFQWFIRPWLDSYADWAIRQAIRFAACLHLAVDTLKFESADEKRICL